jgi:3-deoxy-D-manno-octulosonic-acid transferase
MVVLECLEMWPNLVLACQQRGIPVAVVNGRLSRQSAARYRRARWLFGPCFEGLSLVTALTATDAERFIALGASPRRVTVESSSKHGAVALCRPSEGHEKKLVLGSIHRDEEATLLPWVSRLLRELPGLQVEVAPRHPHRARAILVWFAGRGVDCTVLSRRSEDGPPPPLTVHDTVGALASSYAGASVAFVGGSLNGHGGHNVVEPAARGVPVLTGPHTDHCRQEVQMLIEAGGASRIDGGESFYRRARRLLNHPEEAARRGHQARTVALRLGVASTRIAARLQALLGDR